MSVLVVNGPGTAAPAGAELGYAAAGAACLALLMTASGAFDTDHLTVPHRCALWLVVCGLNVGQAILLHGTLVRRMPDALVWRAMAVCVAVALTILLMTFELHALKFTPLLPKKPDPLVEFALFLTPPVAAMAGFALLLKGAGTSPWGNRKAGEMHGATNDAHVADSAASAAAPAAREPPVLELDAWPDSPVLRVEADDHYLHVVTIHGASFIRGRMKDALVRLQSAEGLQVHRSHWVASDAIVRVVLRGRDYHVVLKDGTRVPVGRSRVDVIRARGWL